MQIITINNQSCITLVEAALVLQMTRQGVHRLVKTRHLETIALTGKSLAITIEDFEYIRDNRNFAMQRGKSRKNK